MKDKKFIEFVSKALQDFTLGVECVISTVKYSIEESSLSEIQSKETERKMSRKLTRIDDLDILHNVYLINERIAL